LNPIDYGSLLNLGQHHGFPTPLLDWTDSPFIAAFFAFRDKPSRRRPRAADSAVRIFILDLKKWVPRNVISIGEVRAAFEPFWLGARDNPRALPQQSVNMFSNIVDIEGHVQTVSQDVTVLRRIDIPISERPIVMHQLRLMGITAASLFPGLDGVCQALAEAYF
jgi:hypothetical protein